MKKYLNCLMLFLLIGSSAGMEVKEVATTEKPLSIITRDGDEIEIPADLAEQSETIQYLIKDLQDIQLKSFQKVSADEQIASISDISIVQSQIDPTEFDIVIRAYTKGLKPITTAFSVSTI